jgi:hypothetical protein
MRTRLQSLYLTAGVLATLALGAAASAASPRPQWVNLARGQAVQFSPPPSYPAVTDPDDAKQMTDGGLATATPMWYDKSAVGWVMVDPAVFTVDLGRDQPIRGVALHVPGGQAGVEWPTSILVYASATGAKYSLVGDLMELSSTRPPEKGYATLWLVADALETHGRFLKFVCSPTNLGNGAYIFVDEVEIYQGEAAWLSRPLVAANAPTQWRAAWQEIPWRDQTASTAAAERPTRLRLIDGASEQGADTPLQQAAVEGGRVRFTLNGEAGRVRSMTWTGKLAKPISTERCRYALLSFRAEGIRRTFEPRPLVTLQGVNDKEADHDVSLLEANMALNDGRLHTLIRPLPEGFTLRQLKLWIASENDAPSLVLERLELLDEVPQVFNEELVTDNAKMPDGYLQVPLGGALNGTLSEWYDRALAAHTRLLDGVRTLPAGPVTVSGVPFVIGAAEKNLALMPESKESSETVDFLGEKVAKRYLAPVSRDDALSLAVDASAREAFLLLALSAPAVQTRGGLPNCAFRLDDIESISVELTYDRGDNETAFPYSLADRGCYVPARELGAYAVAVDPTRRLQRLTLHNHHFGPSFAVAGLTLNTSATALVPELASLPAPATTALRPEPPASPVAVTVAGNRLTLRNRWYEFSVDLAQGFVLDRLVHRASPQSKVTLAPSSGLRVRLDDTVYTGRSFTATVTRLGASDVELKLTSTRPELPLDLTVTITATDSPELAFAAQATNRGEKPLAIELCLPALAGLALGELAHTRLFFPQYRAVDTAALIALRAPYGPEFTGQFMDVYSRPEGIGLMLRTHNPEQRMATFALRKDAAGVSGGVCFPAEYNELAPAASRAYPTVSVLAHGGDWHTAFQLYRDWLRGWYAPHKAQDKDYFLNAWDMTVYRPSTKVSWSDSRVPPIITADRKRFLLDETFAFEKQYLGHVPDLVHFFNWTHNDQKQRNEFGVYGTPLAYAQVGGLEFFRQGIAAIQTTWERPVSLYTLSDRFRASALPDQALSKELAATSVYQELDSDTSAALRAAGAADGIFYPRFGHDKWVNFFVNDIATMQRDTGCRMVYMDVFPYFSHLRGHNGLSPREGDLKVVRRMREALPAAVALWTEYGFTDVASQYADGAVHYYFLDLNEVFARRYNRSDRADELFAELPLNLSRYVLPRYRTFALPCYIEGGSKPSQVDAVFVNGEPFHEDTWRLHASRLRVKLNRAYVVKHEYSDCFSTAEPLPRVDTAVHGIAANLFTGTNRKLWTLYNGLPKTYSGVVLEVPHRDGARYRDAWNGREITPVIAGGGARIALRIDPQQPGCVVQEWKP